MCTALSIVSTQTVAVATLSVNKMKMMVENVYTKSYSVDSNDCCSNVQRKQNENDGWQCLDQIL